MPTASENRIEARLSRAARTLASRPGMRDFAPAADNVISLTIGMPAPDLFPSAQLAALTQEVLAREADQALQYGQLLGVPGLRAYLAARLNEQEGLQLGPDQFIITAGSSQAIAMLGQMFVDPDDTVLVEGPSFIGALRTFRMLGARIVEVALDDSGLVVDDLAPLLDKLDADGVRPTFLYTMPTFQNPTGVTLPAERRASLIALARERDLLIVEDDAYGDLRYDGQTLPSLLSLDRDGLVVRLGTFSKIMAAGVRLGWAVGPPELIAGLASMKVDAGTSPFASHLAAAFGRSGQLDRHIQILRAGYHRRRDAMLQALKEHCAPYATWTYPEGGFFIWVRLKPHVSPERMHEAAAREGVTYVPGNVCFASGEGQECLRLAFSFAPEDQMPEAIARLGRAMASASPSC